MGWLDPASRCRLRTPSSAINSPCSSEDGQAVAPAGGPCAMDLALPALEAVGSAVHQRDPDPVWSSQCAGPHRAVHGKPEEGVPEPLHLHVGGSPSAHRLGLRRLLQRRAASSGDRRHTLLWPRLAEGALFHEWEKPDQDGGSSSARRPSSRLPTRRVASVRSQSPRPAPCGSGRIWSCLRCPTLLSPGPKASPTTPRDPPGVTSGTSLPPRETHTPQQSPRMRFSRSTGVILPATQASGRRPPPRPSRRVLSREPRLNCEQQLRAGPKTRNPARPDGQAGQRFSECARQDSPAAAFGRPRCSRGPHS